MSDAETLLLERLAVIPNGDKVAPLFAEDGVVELPFLHAVGMPARYQGRTQIKDFYRQVGKLYADFGFKPEDTKVLIVTPDQVFAEYIAHARVSSTGRLSYRRSTSAQPERGRSPPSPSCRDLLGSRRLHQLGSCSISGILDLALTVHGRLTRWNLFHQSQARISVG